jgi:hypothetical protein
MDHTALPPTAANCEAEAGTDDILLLDDSYLTPDAPVAASAPNEVTQRIDAILDDETAGTGDLPERLDALVALLAPPATDFAALDLLSACWPRGSHNVTSRALLAVALTLSRDFNLPDKLPMAAARAWQLLDPVVFQTAMAKRLTAIAEFISSWHQNQARLLVLDFGEILLIEHLFEALHPGDNIDLLERVMGFKPLSNRRLGLVRRIPGRARHALAAMGTTTRDEALATIAHYKALVERLAQPGTWAPIHEVAVRALDDINKLMAFVAGSMPALTGESPPLALGRIGS